MKKKKETWTKTRHKIVFTLLRPVFRLFLRIRYGFKGQKYRLEKGPHIILFNHPTAFDPFMVATSFKRPIYFMATDDIFSLKYVSWWIKYLVAPISKSKSFQDMTAVKNMIRIAKEGGTIALAPEGNRTYTGKLCHINPAVVKMIQLLKIPLVLYNIEGGFGVSPRFSPFIRKGKMFGKVNKILSAEEIQNYTQDELYQEIITHLTAEDYLLNRNFSHKKRAEHLERILHICPVCEQKQMIYSYKDKVNCAHCKLEVEYKENLTFHSLNPNFKFTKVLDWMNFQENYIHSLENDGNIVYADDGILFKKVIKNERKEVLLEGSVLMDFEKIILFNKTDRFEFELKDIDSMAVLGQNKINFYVKDEIYQIKPHPKFNAIKYMHLYFHAKHVRKGEKDEFLGI